MEEFDHNEDQPLEAEIFSRDGSVRDGFVLLKERTHQERLARAVRSFVTWSLAAGVSLFIPVLHFILVPVFILAAFFMAANALFDVFRIESGEAICARCGALNKIEPQVESYPIHIDCSQCDSRMTAYRVVIGEHV